MIKCFGLKRADPQFKPRLMLPFFSFDFYTFEYRSPTANGADPTFEVTKWYEIEDSQELQDYLAYQFLKVDFIDESVDLVTQPDVSDYVGSVRIPLRELLKVDRTGVRTYPVNNEKGLQMGNVDIALGYFDANSQ